MGMMGNAAAWVVLATTMAAAAVAEDVDVVPKEVLTGDVALAEVLKRRLPDIKVTAIESSPIPGLRTVQLQQGVTLYVTEDGSHAIAGVLYHLTEDGPVDPAESRRAERRLALLSDVPVEQMIVFAPEGESRAVLNVFTDTDCGYCQKLHAEVPELNAFGIEVRYLAFPRTGIGSETYDRMVSAWCANDPHDAITTLKRGNTIPSKTCDNPVAEQYEIGMQLSVRGTPTMITGEGELIGGYVPAAELAQGLGLQ